MVTSTVGAVVTPTATFIDATIEVFLTPSPPKHAGNPNNAQNKEGHQLLMENVALVEIYLGGGNNGYLGLVFPPDKYA